MRTLYRTQFELSPKKGTEIEFERVVESVRAWARSRPMIAVPADTDFRQEQPQLEVGEGRFVETRAYEGENGLAWGVRLRMPDEEPGIDWVTDTVIHQRDGKTQFSCNLQVGRTGEILSPVYRSANCPGVVKTILGEYEGEGIIRLSDRPMRLGSTMLDLFLELLESPERKHSIIFVSTDSRGQCLTDYRSMAKQLAGLAYVIVAENPSVSQGLGDRLSSRLNCFDAGVRLYWPGFHRSDPPLRHPLWVRALLNSMNRRDKRCLEIEILGRIAAVSSFVAPQAVVSWNRLADWQRGEAIRRAKEDNRQDELIELYDTENRDLGAKVAHLEAELKEKGEEVNELRSANSALKLTLQSSGRNHQPISEEDQIATLTTVAEALDLAQERYPDQLQFVWNSKSDGSDSPFSNPQGVYLALKWLATEYRDAKTGACPCQDLDVSARNAIEGWNFQPHQSEYTMNDRRFRDWYRTKVDGRWIQLKEHLRCGSNKDPRNSIRIAFGWDGDRKVIMLGYLGQHQENRAS